MDLLTIAGLASLVLWAIGTFVFPAPGFIHLFLTLGAFLLVLAAVKRAERSAGATAAKPTAKSSVKQARKR